jgi:hypothetical protein
MEGGGSLEHAELTEKGDPTASMVLMAWMVSMDKTLNNYLHPLRQQARPELP